MSMYNPDYPFLCMDLTYITCLLKSGYGFEEETVLKVMFWQQHSSYAQIDEHLLIYYSQKQVVLSILRNINEFRVNCF